MENHESKSFGVEWVHSRNNPVESNKIKGENIQKISLRGKRATRKKWQIKTKRNKKLHSNNKSKYISVHINLNGLNSTLASLSKYPEYVNSHHFIIYFSHWLSKTFPIFYQESIQVQFWISDIATQIIASFLALFFLFSRYVNLSLLDRHNKENKHMYSFIFSFLPNEENRVYQENNSPHQMNECGPLA